MRISAVVLTKNEEKNIKKCLEGLGFCDEVIIVDDNSNDRTRKTAGELGARVFTRSLNGDFAAQRNFGLDKAEGEWVLFIDADERVSPALAGEISNIKHQTPARQSPDGSRRLAGGSNINGFYLKRRDYFLGCWLRHGETGNIKLLRLGRKNAGTWRRKVHEVWEMEKGRVGELKNPLLHYPHQTISQFLGQINEYTSLDANQFYQEGQRFQFWQLFFYPPAKFFQNYFIRLGFLDGFPGLAMALMMSFHSLVTRVKLWEMEKEEQ